jgi:hypothetical protein
MFDDGLVGVLAVLHTRVLWLAQQQCHSCSCVAVHDPFTPAVSSSLAANDVCFISADTLSKPTARATVLLQLAQAACLTQGLFRAQL